jgi:hypothetical protein
VTYKSAHNVVQEESKEEEQSATEHKQAIPRLKDRRPKLTAYKTLLVSPLPTTACLGPSCGLEETCLSTSVRVPSG